MDSCCKKADEKVCNIFFKPTKCSAQGNIFVHLHLA